MLGVVPSRTLRLTKALMAVDLAISPFASPWSYHDDGVPGPVSPTLRGQTLEDFGSFLPPLRSFHLEGETPIHLPVSCVARSPCEVNSSCSQAQSTSIGASLFSTQAQGCRSTNVTYSAALLEDIAQQPSDPLHAADAPGAAISYHDHLGPDATHWGRPSAEEQAWLDQEMMAMESDSGSVWSPTPSSAHHDEEESEESYVSRILASHPQLEVAEARWLYAQQDASQHRGGGMETG